MLLTHGGVSERTPSTVAEGSEADEFWEALGGKADYPETAKGEVAGREPRLFQVRRRTRSRRGCSRGSRERGRRWLCRLPCSFSFSPGALPLASLGRNRLGGTGILLWLVCGLLECRGRVLRGGGGGVGYGFIARR